MLQSHKWVMKTRVWLFLRETILGWILRCHVEAEAHSCLLQRALLLLCMLKHTLENVYWTNYVLSGWLILN